MTPTSNDDPNKRLLPWGQAAILIGISLLIVAQTVHGAQPVALELNIASAVASLTVS